MEHTSRRAQMISKLTYRQVVAILGLLAIVVAELLRPGALQDLLAGIGFVALLVAAIIIFVHGNARFVKGDPNGGVDPSSARTWRIVLGGLAVFGLLIAQTWFRSGTAIAGGDIAPPIGTAWIGRLFAIHGWSGVDLGGAVANQGQLPWAVIDELVHLAGGSGALAQRIWLSLLIAGVIVAGALLARSLKLSPLAGAVVGLVFFINPMTMSEVGYNDVYLVTMILVAVLPAALIAYGRGTLSLWKLCLVFALSAPFVGFAFANPPLVVMLIVALIATPLLAWARFGPGVGARCFGGVLVGGAVMGAASSYWIIPNALFDSQAVATGRLSSFSFWGFTESRSSLANAFWLNTEWGWSFSEYYPYAHLFREFPLVLVRAVLPLLAFGGLAFNYSGKNPRSHAGVMRLSGILAILTLGLLLLSNGTNAPGSLLFDPLYHLPYGWLLQEPGRFLLIAALGYALLIGLLVDATKHRASGLLRGATARSRHLLGFVKRSEILVLAAVVVALAGSFPIWTGSVIPGPRDGFPSSRVVVPKYWEKTASFLNSTKAPRGALLVLPADDFYQMPYTWYYGNDGFISNSLVRHVVDPSGQGYDKVSKELLSAVELEDAALLSHSWLEASSVLEAIGTPMILVRGDIDSSFPDRNIASPRELVVALRDDPYVHAVHRFGLLSLFEANPSHFRAPVNYATVASSSPNLAALAALPPRTVLITSKAASGHDEVASLPPLEDWDITTKNLVTKFSIPASDRLTRYDLAPGSSVFSVISSSPAGQKRDKVHSISMAHGPEILQDEAFDGGGKLGNCDDAVPVTSKDIFEASVSRTGGPSRSAALTLRASVDAACESATLNWQGGPIILRYSARSIAGNAPQICLWESPVDKCLPIPSTLSSTTPEGAGWSSYSEIVTPSEGTTNISLYLYAYAPSGGAQSIDQYANVQVYSLQSLSPPILIGVPPVPHDAAIVVGAAGYPSSVSSVSGVKEVMADGLRSAWVGDRTVALPSSTSSLLTTHEALYPIVAYAALMLAAAGAIAWIMSKRQRTRSTTPPAHV